MKTTKALLGASLLVSFSVLAACSGGGSGSSSAGGSAPSAMGYAGGFVDMRGDGSSALLVGAPGMGDASAAAGAVMAFDSVSSSSGKSAVTPSWIKTGAVEGGQLGSSFANLGDVDGDGKADFAVGAINDTGEAPFTGAVYVYKGGSATPSLLAKLNGSNPMDKFGWAITGGDVNADGKNDVIVSAVYATGTAFQSGLVYVYFGGATISTTPSVTLNGGPGMSLATGDVNGDGAADLMIGGSSKVVIYYGGSGFAGHGQTPDATISGAKTGGKSGSGFGNAVAYLGDVNADGLGDIAVGNPTRSDPDIYDNIGTLYVFRGSSSYPATVYEDDATLRLAKVIGEGKADRFGASIASAGDVNGGGAADILVGSIWGDGSAKGSGKVYLFHTESLLGKSGALNADATAARTYIGAGNGSELGKVLSVSSSGEFFAGAPNGNGRNGASYVFNIATGVYREITY
ncbi:MAG: FG-GAP repeat protein [Nitrospinae bacterium]|nr:FG-GAP repeat protein [Nitrospinota bacterium]